MGLEQGLTLSTPPSCEGTKTVVVDVGGSLQPELREEDGDGRGQAIGCVAGEGAEVVKYTDLFVTDATGKRLPSWMSVTAGGVSLYVEDAGSTYPLQIDPLIWAEAAKLVASDG